MVISLFIIVMIAFVAFIIYCCTKNKNTGDIKAALDNVKDENQAP